MASEISSLLLFSSPTTVFMDPPLVGGATKRVSSGMFISRGERKTDLVYSAATQLLLQEESEPREAMPNRPLVIYTLLNFYVIRLTYQLYKYMVQTHNKRKQAPRAHNTIIHAKVPNNYPKLHHTKTNGLCVSMVQFINCS